MKLRLHPEWEPAIDSFVVAYNVFAEDFTNVFPRYRRDELMTPKIAYIQHEMKRWIKKFNKSLLYITEQAFEGVHYAFLAVEKNYSIPRTGEEKLAGERRFTSDPSFGWKQKGRKVQAATKKRGQSRPKARSDHSSNESDHSKRAAAKKLSEKAHLDLESKDVLLARKLLCQAVAAFNAQNILSCGEGCYERMQSILEYIESGKDRKNAPWTFKKKKSNSKRKQKEADEPWTM